MRQMPRRGLGRFILRIKHELGIPMIWIEHDMQMVADFSDRIFVLDYGKPLAQGTPEQLLNDPRVIAAKCYRRRQAGRRTPPDPLPRPAAQR